MMVSYDFFSEHYDKIMQSYDSLNGGLQKRTLLIQKIIQKHCPNAKTLLEIGCGTGNILKSLQRNYRLFGLDISEKMLEIARKKVPKATFYNFDMRKFHLPIKFDIIVCVYDSINHLLRLSDWKSMFKCVATHLKDTGIFIFDFNTLYELDRLGNSSPYIKKIGKDLVIMQTSFYKEEILEWKIIGFKSYGKNNYKMYEESIRERGFSIKKIHRLLDEEFDFIKFFDNKNKTPTEKSQVVWAICKKTN